MDRIFCILINNTINSLSSSIFYISSDTDIVFNDCLFQNNNIQNSSSFFIVNNNAFLTLTNCQFINNENNINMNDNNSLITSIDANLLIEYSLFNGNIITKIFNITYK